MKEGKAKNRRRAGPKAAHTRLRSTRLRWRVLYPQTYPQCTHGKEKWGKMGENGGKWGEMGGKWGKMGENKETWVVHLVPFPPHSSPFPPHFPPFSPIFPHFSLGAFPISPHFSSGAFTNAPPPPPHSLVANLNLDFWPFQPLNFPFFQQAI